MQDSILDIDGLRVGQVGDLEAMTGCTVIVAPEGTIGGVDLRGGACGLREVQTLWPDQLAPEVHAICLAGGSAFGLAAADGVMRCLEGAGVGLAVGRHRIPIVPAAILFDLGLGDSRVRPDAAMGRQACEEALRGGVPVRQGNAGAGTGATVGKLLGPERASKGGLGSASERGPAGVRVGALAAINAFGDVVDPRSGRTLAGLREGADSLRLLDTERMLAGEGERPAASGPSTTLAVVATDARLDKVGCARVAAMAQRGLMSTVRPCHGRFDGDVVFCLATGRAGEPLPVEALGVMAARALERAVLRAVLHAAPAGGIPAAAQLLGPEVCRNLLESI